MNGTEILQADVNLQAMCEDLKDHVNNMTGEKLVLVGPTYGAQNHRKIYTAKGGGIEIGYRRTAHPKFVRREVFVKVPGYSIDDLSEEERSRIMTALFNVFIVPGSQIPQIGRVAKDCMLIRQDYVPMIPVERSPGVVSIAGGLG
jgi:hypothetical protein